MKNYQINNSKFVVVTRQDLKPGAQIKQVSNCLVDIYYMNLSTFIKSASIKHNNFYDYSKLNIQKFHPSIKIDIICPIHGVFSQTARAHYKGAGCNHCAQLIRIKSIVKPINVYLKKCESVHGLKYDYSLVDKFARKNDKVKIICKKHGIFVQQLNHHLRGSGCQKCSGNIKLQLVDFIEKANNIHEFKYNYNSVNFSKSKSSISIICPIHGIFKQRLNHHLRGAGCPECQMSNGENAIRIFLNKHNIEFEYQKKFDGCIDKRKLPFDFYLSKYNTCIEYDGSQHFIDSNFFKGNLDDRIKKDKIKDYFCKNNEIKLIRINNIKEIENKLKNLL